MRQLLVVGIDLSMTNLGLARATINLDNPRDIVGHQLKLVQTEGTADKKVVRKNSDDLRRACELREAMLHFCQGAELAIVEVPHGSQSARASWCLGIAVGVLASCPLPIIEVSALEVKMASVGKKNATKAEMIQWAVDRWPALPWLRAKPKPHKLLNDNEHLADAMGTICAGALTQEFKRLLLAVNHESSGTPNVRPPLHSEPKRRVSLGDLEVAPRAVRRRAD